MGHKKWRETYMFVSRGQPLCKLLGKRKFFCLLFLCKSIQAYPASRVSFDLPREVVKRKDLSGKIEGDSARRVIQA